MPQRVDQPVDARPREATLEQVADSERAGEGVSLGFFEWRAELMTEDGLPGWLEAVVQMHGVDALLVTPHWGPNMVAEPVRHVRASAAALRSAGATLIAGHSAHVFHGIGDHTLFDLGDFIDDYARDPLLRYDLGILAMVTFEQSCPTEVECVPLALDTCHTRLADEGEAAWVIGRLRRACAALGTEVWERRGRAVVSWDRHEGTQPT